MKPKKWNKMNSKERELYAVDFYHSTRGKYIISQALVIANKMLSTRLPEHTREISNAEDMEILLELFPIYKIIEVSKQR